MRPLVSVIIPCYNAAEFLPVCMRSLEMQTIGTGNLQMIFVDDASTDAGRTWSCILEFERKHPDCVTAVRMPENRCQGGARNAGLEYALADYICFIDADDWIDASMIKELYDCIESNACDVADIRLAVVLDDGRVCVHEPAADRVDVFEKSIIEGGAHWIDSFDGQGYGGGVVTAIYRKNMLLEHQILFPERVKYEDNYWQSILLLYVKKFYHMAKDLYFYRENADSTIHKRNCEWHFDRLRIEEDKVAAYKKLGVYNRFEKEIERDFLHNYFCSTLTILWSRFDDPPYDVFCEMERTVCRLFPDYRGNPYFQTESVDKMLLGLLGRDLSEKQFVEAGRVVMSCLDE